MAEKTAGEVVLEAAQKSQDEWRAMNGLPPIDHSKKARTKDDPPATAKK